MIKRLFAQSPWSLHNPLKGWTMHGLADREAQLLVQTLSTAERNVTVAWQEGWPAWHHLDEAEAALLIEIPDLGHVAEVPSLPKQRSDDEITQVHIDRKVDSYERGFERVSGEVPVEIILGVNSFKTHTLDFSEGGMRFRDHLPDWVAGYFTVVIRASERSFEVTCILVEDQKVKKNRVEVVETEDEESQLPAYREWVKGRRG